MTTPPLRAPRRAPARGLALALALAALAPLPALAGEVIALLPVTGANVDAGTLEAARDVFRGHLERTGREVRLADGDAVREPSGAEAGAAARAAGAGRAAVVRLSLLGSVLRARLSVYDLSGRQVHADDLPAGTPNDVDPVLQRLAQGYASGGKAAASAEIDTVTDKEAQKQNRVAATSAFGVRLGGFTPTNPSGLKTGVGGGIFWLYDARSFLVDVTFDGWAGDGFHEVAGGFGAYVPFTKGNLAPYAGGGLRYGTTRFLGSWGNGLQANVAGGVLVGRLSTVQIRGEVSWFYDLYTNAGEKRHGLLWSAGVAF